MPPARRWLVAALALALAGACEPPPAGDEARDLATAAADGDARPMGWLRVLAVDEETGLPLPARVVIASFDVAPPPTFDVDPRSRR